MQQPNPYQPPQSLDTPPLSAGEYDYRNPNSFSRWVKLAAWGYFVAELLNSLNSVLGWRFATQAEAGLFDDETWTAPADILDNITAVAGAVQIVFFVVSGILILVWINRANKNARALRAPDITITPGWAVGWYFVPLMNLFRPFQAMKEIWYGSLALINDRRRNENGLLNIWWWTWLLSNMVANAATRQSADTLHSFKMMHGLFTASSLLSMACTVALLKIITAINQAQTESAQQAAQ